MASSPQKGISYCARKGWEEFPDSLQRRADNEFGKWREDISKFSTKAHWIGLKNISWQDALLTSHRKTSSNPLLSADGKKG